jgi:hypothetical protein
VPKQCASVKKQNQSCKEILHIEWSGRRGGVRGIEFGVVGHTNSSCSSGGVYHELSAKARRGNRSSFKSWVFMRSRAGGWGALHERCGLRRREEEEFRFHQWPHNRHQMGSGPLQRSIRSSCWAQGWAAWWDRSMRVVVAGRRTKASQM